MSTKAQVDPDVEYARVAFNNTLLPALQGHPETDWASAMIVALLEAQAVEAERWLRTDLGRAHSAWFENRAADLRRKAKELSA